MFKKDSTQRSFIIFSSFILFAQLTGFLRDIILLRYFGAGSILDTYYMAFKIPDFLSVFYGVFLGSVVFIPLLTKAKKLDEERSKVQNLTDKKDTEVVKSINNIFSLVFILLFIFSLSLFIFMPYLVKIIAPSWDGGQQDLLRDMSRLLLIGQFFFPVGILAGSLCMVYRRPFWNAIAGLVYNLGIFIGALFLSKQYGIYGVVYGVLLGSFCFMFVQIVPSEVRNILKHFKFVVDIKNWLKFIYENKLRFFAVLLSQSFLFIMTYIAAYGESGSVTVFTIAYFLFASPFFLLGSSLGTVLMPKISELHIDGESEKLKIELKNSLKAIFIISTICAIFVAILSKYIVDVLYMFSHIEDTKKVQIAQLLSILMLAFPFFNVTDIVRKYLYATHQIVLATSFTIISIVTILISNFIFIKYLNIAVLNSLGYSFVLSTILSLVIVLFILKKQNKL